jgi:hypothetical protein
MRQPVPTHVLRRFSMNTSRFFSPRSPANRESQTTPLPSRRLQRSARQFCWDWRASEWRWDGHPAQRCNDVAFGATNARQHVVEEIALAGCRLSRKAEMFVLTFAFHRVSPFWPQPLNRNQRTVPLSGNGAKRAKKATTGLKDTSDGPGATGQVVFSAPSAKAAHEAYLRRS